MPAMTFRARNIIKGVIVTNDQNVLWIRLSSNERCAL